MKKLPNSPVAWAQTCRFRNIIHSLIHADWPREGLTRKEAKALKRALHSLHDAQDSIREAQALLAKRCRKDGVQHPAYEHFETFAKRNSLKL